MSGLSASAASSVCAPASASPDAGLGRVKREMSGLSASAASSVCASASVAPDAGLGRVKREMSGLSASAASSAWASVSVAPGAGLGRVKREMSGVSASAASSVCASVSVAPDAGLGRVKREMSGLSASETSSASASVASPLARAISSSTASCTAFEEMVTPETASTAWSSTICSAQAARLSSVRRSFSPSEDTTAWVTLPPSTVMATSMVLKSVVLRTA